MAQITNFAQTWHHRLELEQIFVIETLSQNSSLH